MKLTLHIGHYKTGSTAIQTHFDLNRPAYRRRGLLYPVNGKPAKGKVNHSGFAYQEIYTAGGYIGNWYPSTKEFQDFKEGKKPPARELILQEIERKSPDHVLISSEEFMLFSGDRGVPARQTRKILESFGADEINIVCYLRRPDSYLESWYNQLIKLGQAPVRLSENLDRYMRGVHFRFFDAISYWTNLFGMVNSISLLRYDEVKDDLIKSAIEAVGAPDIGRFQKLKDVKKDPNPRLPNQFIEFARIFNGKRKPAGLQRLHQVIGSLAKDPEIANTSVYVLDEAARKRLYEGFLPIDKQLAAIAGTGDSFFPDLEEMLYIEPGAISDAEAFDRWGMLALQAYRDEHDRVRHEREAKELGDAYTWRRVEN